ncbi:hypothetical protein BJX99DRAFT_81426 [Aspergillus californicus]
MAYCVKCLKLHPRGQFDVHPDTVMFPVAPNLKMWCDHNAGIVDLCLCVALTVHDRVQLIEHLKCIAKGHPAELSGMLGQRFTTTRGKAPQVWHECEIRERGHVLAKIRTTIFISEGKMLVANTQYAVSLRSGHNPFALTAIVPWVQDDHYDLLLAIRTDAQRAEGSDGGGGSAQSDNLHLHCVVRQLGKCHVPVDHYWIMQERVSSRGFHLLHRAHTGGTMAVTSTIDRGMPVCHFV